MPQPRRTEPPQRTPNEKQNRQVGCRYPQEGHFRLEHGAPPERKKERQREKRAASTSPLFGAFGPGGRRPCTCSGPCPVPSARPRWRMPRHVHSNAGDRIHGIQLPACRAGQTMTRCDHFRLWAIAMCSFSFRLGAKTVDMYQPRAMFAGWLVGHHKSRNRRRDVTVIYKLEFMSPDYWPLGWGTPSLASGSSFSCHFQYERCVFCFGL